MTYHIIPWDPSLDLTEFYKQAEIRGFTNNSSQKSMIDCFKNEREYRVWILYYNDIAVGSVAAHSLDIVNGYRICARTCVFTDLLPTTTVRTQNQIITHQHVTAQFFMPVCIEYAGINDVYITTHPSDVGTQKLVHNVWAPNMANIGLLEKTHELLYRGHVQTFWKLDKQKFLKDLENYPRWQLSSPI